MSFVSLKAKLLKYSSRIIFIPVLLVLFLIAFILIYKDIKEKTLNEFKNEQLLIARTASQGITSLFDDYESALVFLSQLSDVIDFNENGKALVSNFYDAHKGNITAVTRVDSSGTILFTEPLNPSVIGSDISYQKHVQQVIKTQVPVVSDVFMAAQGYLAIAIHVPVFKKEKFLGSLAILVPIDEIGKLYLSKLNLRGNGNAWLVSENGIEIYCPLQGHTGNQYIENTNHSKLASQFLKEINSNISGTFKSVHTDFYNVDKPEIKEMLIAYFRTPLKNTYWTILISFDEDFVYLTLTRLRIRLLFVFILLLIAISYYSYSLANIRSLLREDELKKQSEKSLQESEEKFRRIFEDHSAVKLLIDPNSGSIVDANKAASTFYGWTREELKSMKVSDLNIMADTIVKENLQKIKNNTQTKFELKHVLKSGVIRDVEVYSGSIVTGNLEVLHSIIHDITDRKQIEVDLINAKLKAEESDRLKTAFLQNMSHEIRTPMNAIMGFSSLLVDSYNNKERLEKYSEIINQRCEDLLLIINDILDISKIESGQISVNLELCTISEITEDLVLFFTVQQKRFEKPNVILDLKSNCTIPNASFYTDKVKLRQILINLLSNAFKFTESGKIEFGCKVNSDGELVFYVSDTGIGISKENFGKIFDRFTQINPGRDKIVSGNGLGLSVVKGLVDLLNGKIWLESEVGKGTCFFISVPYKVGEKAIIIDPEVSLSPVTDFSGKALLLVEDDTYNANYIREILDETGMEIIHVSDGKNAIEKSNEKSFDIILMDIRLPDVSGYEVMQIILKQRPGAKIIVQTAYAGLEERKKAISFGSVDYISKPMKREDLLEIIRKQFLK